MRNKIKKLLWAVGLFAGLNLISLLRSDLPTFAAGIRNWVETDSCHLEIPCFILQFVFWGLGLLLSARLIARARKSGPNRRTEETAS